MSHKYRRRNQAKHKPNSKSVSKRLARELYGNWEKGLLPKGQVWAVPEDVKEVKVECYGAGGGGGGGGSYTE